MAGQKGFMNFVDGPRPPGESRPTRIGSRRAPVKQGHLPCVGEAAALVVDEACGRAPAATSRRIGSRDPSSQWPELSFGSAMSSERILNSVCSASRTPSGRPLMDVTIPKRSSFRWARSVPESAVGDGAWWPARTAEQQASTQQAKTSCMRYIRPPGRDPMIGPRAGYGIADGGRRPAQRARRTLRPAPTVREDDTLRRLVVYPRRDLDIAKAFGFRMLQHLAAAPASHSLAGVSRERPHSRCARDNEEEAPPSRVASADCAPAELAIPHPHPVSGRRGTVLPSGKTIGSPAASRSTRLARNASAFAAIRASSSCAASWRRLSGDQPRSRAATYPAR